MKMYRNAPAVALFRNSSKNLIRIETCCHGNKPEKILKNGGKFFKWVENTVGKGEIARYEQFLLCPQCF